MPNLRAVIVMQLVPRGAGMFCTSSPAPQVLCLGLGHTQHVAVSW